MRQAENKYVTENKHTFAHDITAILLKYRVIQESEAKAMREAFAQSESEQFDDFLLEEGLVEKSDLLKALSEYYKQPVCDVVGEFFDRLLVTNFPKDFLLRNAIIPKEIDVDEVVIIAADPSIPGLVQAIERFTDNGVVFMVGLRRDICDAVKEFYDEAPTEDIPEDLSILDEHRQQIEEKALEEHEERVVTRIEEE